MTRNVERDKLCTFTEQLIDDFEKSRDQETTDLGQQFAVNFFPRTFLLIDRFCFETLFLAIAPNDDAEERMLP